MNDTPAASATDAAPDGERRAAWLAAGWLFCWFVAQFIQRPLRDDFGIAQGVNNLPMMFGATALVVLPASLAFSALSARRASTRFVPALAVIFIAVLGAFALLLHFHGRDEGESWIARGFYVWSAVYTLFGVSVFWGTMAELFSSERAKRWYGLLSAGGTCGAIAGSAIVERATEHAPDALGLSGTSLTIALLSVAIGFIALGTFFFVRLARVGFAHRLTEPPVSVPAEAPALVGLRRVLRSKYLLGICAFLALYTITSTCIYLANKSIVEDYFGADRDGRKGFFAKVDMITQSLSLLLQLLVTSAFLRRLGVTRGLAFVPAITAIGFVVVGIHPTLLFIVVFEIVRKVAEYAVTRPSREVLFTVVARNDKYPAKVFIDTVVYRLGDALGAAMFAAVSLSTGVALIASAPIAVLWLFVGLRLGRRQAELSQSEVEARVAAFR